MSSDELRALNDAEKRKRWVYRQCLELVADLHTAARDLEVRSSRLLDILLEELGENQ